MAIGIGIPDPGDLVEGPEEKPFGDIRFYILTVDTLFLAEANDIGDKIGVLGELVVSVIFYEFVGLPQFYLDDLGQISVLFHGQKMFGGVGLQHLSRVCFRRQ